MIPSRWFRSSSLRWALLPTSSMLLAAIVSLAWLQSAAGFLTTRTRQSCRTGVGSSSYYPLYAIDTSDLERYATLMQLTDPSSDAVEIDMAEFTSLMKKFRERTNERCAETYFPLSLPTSHQTVRLGGKGSSAVQVALDDCMCARIQHWLLQKTLEIYRCDLPTTHQVDLLRRLRRKADRFNRFIRFQLAVLGDESIVEVYDVLVEECVHAYLDDQIIAAGGGVHNEVPSRSTPAPSTPSAPNAPKKVSPPPTASPTPPKTTSPSPTTTPPPVKTSDLAASGGPTPSEAEAREECRTAKATCNANEILVGDLSVLARRLSALLLVVTSIVVVVMIVELGALGIICSRAWRRLRQRQEYQPVAPLQET